MRTYTFIYDRDPATAWFNHKDFTEYVVFLPAKEVDTTNKDLYGLYGFIVLTFSTEVLSLPFTPSPPQRTRIFLEKDLNAKQQKGLGRIALFPLSIFRVIATGHVHKQVYTNTHTRNPPTPQFPSKWVLKILPNTLLLNLILAGSVLPVGC